MITAEQAKRNINAEITRRNNIFSNASKAEKRVLVAKDVLQQLKNGKFEAQIGSFVEISLYRLDESQSIQEYVLGHNLEFENGEPACKCCAYGALALSCTLFNNNSTVEDVDAGRYEPNSINELSNGFTELFSAEQRRLIEIAFEEGAGFFFAWRDETKDQRAATFCAGLEPATKMRKIMKNIIENNGTFKP